MKKKRAKKVKVLVGEAWAIKNADISDVRCWLNIPRDPYVVWYKRHTFYHRKEAADFIRRDQAYYKFSKTTEKMPNWRIVNIKYYRWENE